MKNKLLLFILSIALIVLLFLVPTQLKLDKKLWSDEDKKLQEALTLINGERPMEGILMLREIAEKNPQNLEAQYQLGLFSLQTNQYEKAFERFEKVLQIDSLHKDGLYAMGSLSLMHTKDSVKALYYFEKLDGMLTDADRTTYKDLNNIINHLKGQ